MHASVSLTLFAMVMLVSCADPHQVAPREIPPKPVATNSENPKHWVKAIVPGAMDRYLQGVPITFVWNTSPAPGEMTLRIDAGPKPLEDTPLRYYEHLRSTTLTIPEKDALPPGEYTWSVILNLPFAYEYTPPRRFRVLPR